MGGSGGGGAGGGGSGGGGSGGSAPDAAPPDAAPDVSADGPSGPFALTSSVFVEQGVVPTMYRCRTPNVSPPLAWTPGPATTKSYALTMAHGTALHWAIWDIPLTTSSLPMGVERAPMPMVPMGAKQAEPMVDGSTWFGYSGPCPGSPNQKYQYIIWALGVDKLPNVTPQSAIRTVYNAIMANKVASFQLEGTASP
jgi:Raf kinase inhibitor-like YbhB/YbcL family protein